MNREILFRAKRIDNGEWVEGCLLIDYVSGQYFIHSYGNSVNESDKVNQDGCLKFFAYEVDPETVCEYTGLNDENGRKIFEGDICKDGDNIVRILWNDKHQWGVEISNTDSALSKGLVFPLWQYDNCEENGYRILEVIGNIFGNPELLNG